MTDFAYSVNNIKLEKYILIFGKYINGEIIFLFTFQHHCLVNNCLSYYNEPSRDLNCIYICTGSVARNIDNSNTAMQWWLLSTDMHCWFLYCLHQGFHVGLIVFTANLYTAFVDMIFYLYQVVDKLDTLLLGNLW